MLTTASSMPPIVNPRQSRRRPTLRFRAAGEVIDFALVTVYGLSIGSAGACDGSHNSRYRPSMPPHVCLRQGLRRSTPRFCAAGEVADFALVRVYGLNNGSVCLR
jgi:hypothetical protein